MKIENILKRFLPSTISPQALENFANNIELFGKIGAGIFALLYVTGVVVLGLYQSSLHVRSIELLQARYLFVGFYYLLFLFLHLVVPTWWIKRFWVKAFYLLSLLVVVMSLDPIYDTYLTFLTTKWVSSTCYFEFTPNQKAALNSDLSILLTSFFAAPLSVIASMLTTKLLGEAGGIKVRFLSVFFILFAFSSNYQVFSRSVFPFIPDAVGGGRLPIVHIVFADSVPYEVTSNFDIAGRVDGYGGHYYYGRLVYIDNESVFLEEPFWYAQHVYEIQREDIIMLEYKEHNPAEIGEPGLFP